YIACHPERGCLVGLDCDVACERDLENVVDCAGSYDPCKSDLDCGGARCMQEGNASGDCTTGLPGSACLDDGDCRTGSCVAVALDGERKCQDGKSGSACNDAKDCTSGLACLLP